VSTAGNAGPTKSPTTRRAACHGLRPHAGRKMGNSAEMNQ
jgi:hypothetical protein